MRKAFVACLLSCTLLLFSGCGDDSTSSDRGGQLRLLLTDAPIELQEVSVTLSGIEVHKTGGPWEPFANSATTIDLLDIQDTEALLATGNLAEGRYTGIRLQVDEGFIVDTSGERCDLTVPSDKVQINANFEIQDGEMTTVLADFDAEQSVHVVRTGNQRTCILRPVITPVRVDNP